MDSEWDKNILRVVIASQRSRDELEQLDFNCHDVRMLTDQVVALIEEREQAKIAAADMTTLRIKKRIDCADEMISSNELKMKRKRLDWTDTQLAEIMDETDSLKERKQDLQGPLAPTEKKQVKEMIRRTQLNLINENRIGLSRKGSGRPITVDELDEQFLLNCIESNTTAHGRRHDQVL